MASPAPALARLKAQLHAKWPVMLLAELGIMADARHIAGGTSDHILGNALDIPAKLAKAAMKALALLLLKDPRVHYVIWDRVFYHEGKAPAVYTGSDPHTGHIHLSIYPAKRADDRDWVIARAVKTYATSYCWIDAEVPSANKAAFVAEITRLGLKLEARKGVGYAVLGIHVGADKLSAVHAALARSGAVRIVQRPTSGGGTIAPDNSIRRLNAPTTTVL